MITTDSKSRGGTQDSTRTSNQRGRNNDKRRQDKRPGKQQGHSYGKPITECGYCNLIKEKDVSQEYVQKDFDDMHWRVSDKSIWPHQCLPWLMLDADERIKRIESILQDLPLFTGNGRNQQFLWYR